MHCQYKLKGHKEGSPAPRARPMDKDRENGQINNGRYRKSKK